MPDAVSGQISIWSGSIVSIPDGWFLCDGTNGTPDLRNKFVVGAGDTYAVGANGGSEDHPHNFRGNGHSHINTGGAVIKEFVAIPTDFASEEISGETDNGSTLPLYYSLAYVMYG